MDMEISALQKPSKKVLHQRLQMPLRTPLFSKSSQQPLILFYRLHKGITKILKHAFKTEMYGDLFKIKAAFLTSPLSNGLAQSSLLLWELVQSIKLPSVLK